MTIRDDVNQRLDESPIVNEHLAVVACELAAKAKEFGLPVTSMTFQFTSDQEETEKPDGVTIDIIVVARDLGYDELSG